MAQRHVPLRLLLALVALVALHAGRGPRAGAAAADLFFSEYIEGSSNNKALEIYNGTGAPVDLAAGGYNVFMSFNGGTSTLTINLAGTVADGDVFVVANASANAAILAQADQTNGSGWFNGDDAVQLRKGTTVVDAIGQQGVDPGSEWGSGLTSTADNTLRRSASVCAGDLVPGDAFDPATEWTGLATDTIDGLGVHAALCEGDAAPSLTSSSPASGAAGVVSGASIALTFSEPVTLGPSSIVLTCTASGGHAFAVTGGPTTFTVDPDTNFQAGETCQLTISATAISDVDAIDPPDTAAADVAISFTIGDGCGDAFTAIPAIQGAGASAAITGAVTTEGIVVGDYEGPSPALRGFFIQDASGDGNPDTSDGLFVFNGSNDSVSLGSHVRVTGTAAEFQGQTQISASAITSCGAGTVEPTDVFLPAASATDFERFEGMLVRLPQSLDVTEHFQLGRFGQVVVSSGGRLRQPTDAFAPGADADALQAANDLSRLIIDDAPNSQNPDPIVFGRGGAPLSASNTLRAGDTLTGAVGVMTYTWSGNAASGNAYRVRPVNALNGVARFEPTNPRPTEAPAPTGTLRVAGMNLLNFFNTFDGSSSNPPYACAYGVGGAATDCRGADDADEFARQSVKTVAAIVGTKADVVGIIEVENDGYGPDSALQFLVDRLNAATAAGTWAYVDVDAAASQVNALGTDAIKVGVIYKPARVLALGTAALNTPSFVTGGDGAERNRPSLAQAFEEIGTGARIVVSVNHLKSKGSACDEADAGDGQGECNAVRTRAAAELAAWLATDPTSSGDADVLLLGDLNAYGQEDPVRTLTGPANGFTNLVPAYAGDYAYSYVFDGQWGSLDHALANVALRPQVTNTTPWFINADEPSVLDYNVNFKSAGQISSLYAPDAFRISDHNPVLVDLALTTASDRQLSVSGSGSVVLTTSSGAGAADPGSVMNMTVNAKYLKDGTPILYLSLVLRREVDGVQRVYQVRAQKLVSLVRDPASGRATVVARGAIRDITEPSAPVTIDANATVRLSVDDNGKLASAHDGIGAGVWTSQQSLWLSTGNSGASAPDLLLAEGNIYVH